MLLGHALPSLTMYLTTATTTKTAATATTPMTPSLWSSSLFTIAVSRELSYQADSGSYLVAHKFSSCLIHHEQKFPILMGGGGKGGGVGRRLGGGSSRLLLR